MTDTHGSAGSQFKVSSYSAGGNCVEVDLTQGDGLVAMRHSRRTEEPPLLFNGAEWDAFIAGVKDGEFDRP